jgi:hypothetical protein
VGKFGRVSEVVSQSVPLGTRWRGAAVSVQRCFVPRTSTRLITKFAPLGAKMAEQAVGLTRRGQAVGWRGVGKPWRRKKLRHYSAERIVWRKWWLTRCGTLFRRDAALCGWGNAVTFGSGSSADLAKGYHIFAAKAAYCRRHAASWTCR